MIGLASRRESGPRAPTAIVERLRAYDRFLEIRWNPVLERWQIGRVRPGTEFVDYVMTVSAPDGSYLPLDERVLERIAEMDLGKWHRGIRGQLSALDGHNAMLKEAAWKAGEAGRRDLWRDMWNRHVRRRVGVGYGGSFGS